MGASFSKSKQKKGKIQEQKNVMHTDYNIKILIRGERGSGKTALLKRFIGIAVSKDDEYVPSTSSHCSTLEWKWRGCDQDDTIHLSFLDVVDNLPNATQVDLYDESVGAVIFIIDIRQEWSSYYLVGELQRVPTHIPILVFGNFIDIGERKTHNFQVQTAFPRTHDANNMIVYTEGSVITGIGLFIFRYYLKWAFLIYQRHLWEERLRCNAHILDHIWIELKRGLEDSERKIQQFEARIGQDDDSPVISIDDQLNRHISFLVGNDEMMVLQQNQDEALRKVKFVGSLLKCSELESEQNHVKDQIIQSKEPDPGFQGLDLDTSEYWKQ